MKITVQYSIKACLRKWWRYITAISLSMFILIFSYLLGNTSFPLPNEIELFQKINGWNAFLGVQKGNMPDSILFINVCYDKELVDYEENGIPVGKYVITDREKLLRLLTQAKKANNYRYIFLDVIFEEGIKSPIDSALFHTIASMDRIVIPMHKDVTLDDSILYPKAANADYTIAWEETNFARYQFLHKGIPSVPLRMYADRLHLNDNGIKAYYGGLWYEDQDRWCRNGVTLMMNIRMTGRLMDTEGQVRERNYIHLGADLLDLDSIIPVKDQIEDKIIVIGDFKNDIHDTYVGPQPGSVICMNAYLALLNGDHLINFWCVLALFLVYTTIGLWYLSGQSVTDFIKWRWLQTVASFINKRVWLQVFFSFISTSLFFAIVGIIAYHFNVAFNVWIPTIIYSTLDAVMQRYNDFFKKKNNEKIPVSPKPDTGS